MKAIFYFLVFLGYLAFCTIAGLFLYGAHRGQEALKGEGDE